MHKFDLLAWSAGTGKGQNCGHPYTSTQITENSELLYMEYLTRCRYFNFHFISYMESSESWKISWNDSDDKKLIVLS